MIKPVVLSALLIALPAAPAFAEEAAGGPRAEVRGGVAWADGETDPVLGIAAGYDFDLGDTVFLGGEVSGEKILAEDTYVELALTGRLGTKVSEKGSIFLVGGYTFTHHGDGPHAGIGYEYHLGHSGTYIAAEYRHVFVDHHEANAVTIGIGTFF
ncbi:outer membrane beta-barrel protein [Citromicrobium bathyomarinum]